MGTQPVTLSAEQVEDLYKKIAKLRHDINNHLSLVVAATELIRLKPEQAEKMAATVAGAPMKISEAVGKFSSEFEQLLKAAAQK
jgi:hypothetical protein